MAQKEQPQQPPKQSMPLGKPTSQGKDVITRKDGGRIERIERGSSK